MPTRRALLPAAALACAGLIAGCSSSGGGGSKTISGGGATSSAPSASSAPVPTPSPSSAAQFGLPADLKLDFNEPSPTDPAQVAALTSVVNMLEAFQADIVRKSKKGTELARYAATVPWVEWNKTENEAISADGRYTGTYTYSNWQLSTKSPTVVVVSYCQNRTQSARLNLATGKRYPLAPTDPVNYEFFVNTVTKEGSATWLTTVVAEQTNATQCR